MKKAVFWIPATLTLLALWATAGCRSGAQPAHAVSGEGEVLSLPVVEPVDLGASPLQVVATTSIIGDVVAQVGGAAIDLNTLMGPGQDPHSYEPTPQQMAAVAQSHVVFVNGWDLEEALAQALVEIAGDVPIVPISAGIEPLPFDAHEGEGGHAHAGADPHVWFDVHNVEQWVENVKQVLSQLDPAHSATYAQNAEAYRAQLAELNAYASAQFAGLPAEKRYLVTNHASFGYLAHAYGLDVLGTVLPAASTLAEPSPSDLAALVASMQEHGLCTIFSESTVSDELAQAVADELAGCDQVAVVKLYTGSIGPPGSGAESYIGMFRHNVDAIVAGLQ